ncbi:MAG: hypothetical protein M3Y69_06085 [Verrucomicrobiota bacterium]|nr:hypothetical protein [Verrucomicrobiota bacterium]
MPAWIASFVHFDAAECDSNQRLLPVVPPEDPWKTVSTGARDSATSGIKETQTVWNLRWQQGNGIAARPMLIKRIKRELPLLVGLAVVVILLWTAIYKRQETLSDPIAYGGDSVFIYAIVKAVQTGEIGLFGSKEVSRLGAPFVANWNDYPWTEDFLYYTTGILARIVGVPNAVNLAFLAAFVLAACSFYTVARYMRWRWPWAFAGAVLYGCSYYVIRRSVDHFNIVFYWTCPLWLLLCWWTASRRGIRLFGRKFAVALTVVIFTAWNNPYYSNLFLQLLTLAVIARFCRGYSARGTVAPIVLGVICIGLVLSMHLDTFFYQLQHGPNHVAVSRSLNELELYALRPVDLFLPFYHRIDAWQTFTRNYASKTTLYGEVAMTYLGLVGIAALLLLLIQGVVELLKGRKGKVNGMALQALWLAVYSMAGSLNMVLGLAGIYLFRAMNRVSVILLTLALLYFVRFLSRSTRMWRTSVVALAAAVLIMIGLWDQTLDYNPDYRKWDRDRMKSDRSFGRRLDETFASGSMLFQLPTMRFPDAPAINKMPGYDHLRPYIFTSHVRFSHGDDSGRPAERWRDATGRLKPLQLLEELERDGFSGLLVDTEAYQDGGKSIIKAFAENGRDVKLRSKRGDFIVIGLHPSESPRLPSFPPEEPNFASGWYAAESDGQNVWHWSSGDARIEFVRSPLCDSASAVSFLLTAGDRTVDIKSDNRLLRRIEFRGDKHEEEVTLPLEWREGSRSIVIDFVTDSPPSFPSSGDPRALAFCLHNLTQQTTPRQ